MDYKTMVNRIRETAEEMRQGAVRVVTKKIPDTEGTNRLDPRLFAAAKNGVGISYPKDNRSITKEELACMRGEIGAPNTPVTQGQLTEGKKILTQEGCSFVFYLPKEQENLPVLIYIHGGGFLGGKTEMCENLCRDLARSGHAAVFSVEYRLAPEHPYPAGLWDCFRAVDYILAHLSDYGADENRVSIAGDSAGGNLALCCSMREAQRGTKRIRRQFLLYPAVNIGKHEPEGYRWREDFYGWSADGAEREVQKKLAHDVGIFDDLMTEAYAGGIEKTKDPYVSPLLNRDWHDMPETVIALGEYDYLTQEGMYLAQQIAKAGTPVTVYHYLGMCHAFAENLGAFPQAEDLMREIAQAIKKQ